MARRFTRFLRRNTIALLALFIALSGTTYAASSALLPRNSVGTPQLKNGAVTKKKINKKTLKALKGNRGLTGARGATGPRGATGVQGVAGSAAAFAHISATGAVDSAKNVSAGNVTHPGTGLYCFSGLGFTVQSIVVTPDFPFGRIAQARVDASALGCGAGKSEVALYTADSPALTDTPFYVVFN